MKTIQQILLVKANCFDEDFLREESFLLCQWGSATSERRRKHWQILRRHAQGQIKAQNGRKDQILNRARDRWNQNFLGDGG